MNNIYNGIQCELVNNNKILKTCLCFCMAINNKNFYILSSRSIVCLFFSRHKTFYSLVCLLYYLRHDFVMQIVMYFRHLQILSCMTSDCVRRLKEGQKIQKADLKTHMTQFIYFYGMQCDIHLNDNVYGNFQYIKKTSLHFPSCVC